MILEFWFRVKCLYKYWMGFPLNLLQILKAARGALFTHDLSST